MSADGKSVLFGHLFLQGFNLAILEFNNFIARRADEMVVVSFVRDVVELGLTSEMLFLCQAGLAQQFQRAVYGRQSDVRVFFGKQPIQLLGRYVFHFQKGGEDVLPLAGQFEMIFPEMLFENVQFFGGLGHFCALPRYRQTRIKTEMRLKGQAGKSGDLHGE